MNDPEAWAAAQRERFPDTCWTPSPEGDRVCIKYADHRGDHGWVTEDTPLDLFAALRVAHGAAECGDYYCGCWDSPLPWNLEDPFPHSTKFVAALAEQGYAIVRQNAGS